MTLHDESLQWIYNHIDEFKQAVVALDFAKQTDRNLQNKIFRRADDLTRDLAFSFLMLLMGEHLPKTLWSVTDYSVLYGIIMDDDDDMRVSDCQ